nr:uncharacterized protein [Tanacetum cinerariifolium]
MWEAIKTRNLRAYRVKEARLQTLITEFKNLKMSDNDTIHAYATKLSGIASKSATLGEVMSKHKLVKKYLTRLPRCFGVVNLMHKLAKGVPITKLQDQVCGSCMVGKQTKKSFSKKATYRASRILVMVHEDIWGPITPSTQPCNSCILVLIVVFLETDGSNMKYKARVVAKGSVQQPEIDFDDVFASVARLETIRLLIALAARKG